MSLCGILIHEKRAINDKNRMNSNKVMSKKFWAKVPARTIMANLAGHTVNNYFLQQ